MIFLSASQLETVELCPRKSFLKSVAKLPDQPAGDSTLFGTVLHAVAERYLLGSEDLYPDGWDSSEGQRLDPRDAVLIRLLIDKAIEAGYLERRKGGQVEQEFRLQFDAETIIIGYIDYETEDRVEDHKTSKSDRYLKSADGLRKSIQMMIYAYKKLEDAKLKGVVLESVMLCHNQYLRDYDDPRVRRREAEVTRQEILNFWESTIVPLAIRAKNLRTLQSPFDIPDPPKNACRAFGGCAFISICGGQETPEQFKKRLAPKPQTMTIQPRDPKQYLAERAAARGAPSVNPPAAPAPTQAPAPAVAATTQATNPPWWKSDPPCPVCKANPGFSSKGNPCRICIGQTKVSTEGYEWKTEPDGKVTWWKQGQQVAVSQPAVSPTVADTGSKRTYGIDDLYALLAKTAPEDLPALAEKAVALLGEGTEELKTFLASIEAKAGEETPKEPAPAPVTEPPKEERKVFVDPNPTVIEPLPPKTEEPAFEPAPKKGKKLEGFTILIGALPLKGVDKVVFCEEFLNGLGGYWQDPDVWGRRGKVSNTAEKLADKLRGMTLVQRSNDPDCTNLVTALVPHAKVVLQAIG